MTEINHHYHLFGKSAIRLGYWAGRLHERRELFKELEQEGITISRQVRHEVSIKAKAQQRRAKRERNRT